MVLTIKECHIATRRRTERTYDDSKLKYEGILFVHIWVDITKSTKYCSKGSLMCEYTIAAYLLVKTQ